MKQFNVRDDTHALGRELSHITGKSIIIVVSEALELYALKLKEGDSDAEDVLIKKLLREATGIMEEELCAVMCSLVHSEVTRAVVNVAMKLRERQEEVFEAQKREVEQILKEAVPEEPTEADEHDDLEEVSYEEFYGKDEVVEDELET